MGHSVNASPDILTQLQGIRSCSPRAGFGITALVGIVLCDGAGRSHDRLYMLREATRPWPLWCTDSVYADLTRGNPILEVLAHYCGVDRRRLDPGEDFSVDGVQGQVARLVRRQ